MLPTEFVESFETQYPSPTLDYKLPESLDRCPLLKDYITNMVQKTQSITLLYMDEHGVEYNLLDRTYRTNGVPVKHALSKNGFDIIFDKVYKTYADNLSPRAFAFIVEDLSDIDNVKFAAELSMQTTQYFMTKAIAMQQSWMTFCMEYKLKFKMKFNDYNDFLKTLA